MDAGGQRCTLTPVARQAIIAIMQSTWGVAEARAQFGKVLEAARRGTDQVITCRGAAAVRVTASHTPTPRQEHLHYLVVALAERDAATVALALRDGVDINHVRFISETSSDLVVWLFDEFGPEWCADYVRALILSLRTALKSNGAPISATASDVVNGLRRSPYNSRLSAIMASDCFNSALRSRVLLAFPTQDRRAAMGDLYAATGVRTSG